MARRTKQQALATRESILDAAEWCYRHHGVAATTAAGIAKRAGCTRGAVYWHFANQHVLLRTVIERGFPCLSQHLEAALASVPAHWLAALQESLLAFIAHVDADPHAQSALEIVLHRCEFSDPSSQACLIDCAREEALVQTTLERFFTQARDAGELPASHQPREAAALLMFTLMGIWKVRCMPAQSRPFDLDERAALQLLFQTFQAAAAPAT